MSPIDVESSVLGRISEAYQSGNYTTDEAYWGSPDDFDIHNQSIVNWAEGYCDILPPPAQRRGDLKQYPLRIVVHVWSRSTTNTLEAKRLASAIHDNLRHACFSVSTYNEDTVQTDGIGNVRLYEPQLSEEQADKGIQHIMLTVDGHATEGLE